MGAASLYEDALERYYEAVGDSPSIGGHLDASRAITKNLRGNFEEKLRKMEDVERELTARHAESLRALEMSYAARAHEVEMGCEARVADVEARVRAVEMRYEARVADVEKRLDAAHNRLRTSAATALAEELASTTRERIEKDRQLARDDLNVVFMALSDCLPVNNRLFGLRLTGNAARSRLEEALMLVKRATRDIDRRYATSLASDFRSRIEFALRLDE
jgi:hypothetical protein